MSSDIDSNPDRAGNYRQADPIFILGNRRSGTTLLNNLLCQYTGLHPQIAEAQPLTHLLSAFAWSEENYERMTKDYFCSLDHFRSFQKQTAELFMHSALLANEYPARMILKNPELSFHLSALLWLFPNSHFISCTRDPGDQIASEFEVTRRRGEDLILTTETVDRLITSFCNYLLPTLNQAEVSPTRVRLVCYEEIVTRPTDILAELAAFCGVAGVSASAPEDWSDDKRLIARLRDRPSFSTLYGKPVSAERIGRSETLLPRELTAHIRVSTAAIMQRVARLRPSSPSDPSEK